MPNRPHIFLVPGFFGFAHVGEVAYFHHVETTLKEALAARDLDVEVVAVPTLPTAGLTQRASRLLETIQSHAGEDEDLIIVGHSTGGLDARLLTTPGVELDAPWPVEPVAERIKALIFLSTPHRGTPVAAFFTSLIGQQLLRLLSLMTLYTLRVGRLPAQFVRTLVSIVPNTQELQSTDPQKFHALYESLLGNLPTDRRETLEQLIQDMALDQRLMPQLAPEALEIFNASTADRPGVKYGSVITATRPPGLRTAVRAGIDPYAQASHTFFSLVWWIASRTPRDRIPALGLDIREALTTFFGTLPTWRDSDGVVPTLSQPWGDLIHCAYADHLDTIGHFHGPSLTPPHRDWITAGSDFRRADFDLLWDKVAEYASRSLK